MKTSLSNTSIITMTDNSVVKNKINLAKEFDFHPIDQWEAFYIDVNSVYLENLKNFTLLKSHQMQIELTEDRDETFFRVMERNANRIKIVKVNLEVLNEQTEEFEKSTQVQVEKCFFFIKEHIRFYKNRIVQIKRHLDSIKCSNKNYDDEEILESALKSKKYHEYMDIYDLAIKELHKEMVYLIKFIQQNSDFLSFINKNFQNSYTKGLENLFLSRYSQEMKEIKNEVNKNDNEYINVESNKNGSLESVLRNKITMINSIKAKFSFEDLYHQLEIQKDSLESIFESKFRTKYGHSGQILINHLRKNSEPAKFTTEQIFFFGFIVGNIFLTLIFQISITSYIGFDIEYNFNFKSVFPIFRGFFLICFFLWMVGWNVYIWNKFHINYKLCFRFTSSSSTLYEVLNRAGLFSLLSLILMLGYFLSRQRDLNTFLLHFANHDERYRNDESIWYYNDVFPLILWILLFIYLIIPFDIFNYKGRKYFWSLLIESILSPIYFLIDLIKLATIHDSNSYISEANNFLAYLFVLSMNTNEFKHIWFTDQLTSFVGGLRDMEYSVCYVRNYHTEVDAKLAICHNQRIAVLFVGMIPNVLRIFQCFRAIISSANLHPQIINAGKYFLAMLTQILAFSSKTNIEHFNMWWILAIISTIYSSYWDIKYDFGFLSGGYILRKKLSYNSTTVYYIIIFVNFVLRFGWILTMSPEVMSRLLYPEFSLFFVFKEKLVRQSLYFCFKM